MSNKCVMKKTAKYTSEKRISPAFEANNCCDEYRWGNDMYLYKSIADKKGICKWQRIKQLRDAADTWTGLGSNNLISYGCPYNYDRTSRVGMGCPSNDHKYGTIIDLNIIPSFDLERLDGKDYTLRGEDDINEMKKYVSSDDLYEWFANKIDDFDYKVVDYGVRNTETTLVGVSVYHLGNSYKDGIQFNFTLNSKLPLDKYEISFAVESLTSFDDDGNYPLKIKGGRKYKKNPLVFTSVPSDYKISTWVMTNKLVNGRYYKNLKTVQIGKHNTKKMPTFPILDAKQHFGSNNVNKPGTVSSDNYRQARFMYPKNKSAHDKHKNSAPTKEEKPPKSITSSKKDQCTKRNPSPPCKKGFEPKTNKKGNRCCYKSKSKPSKPSKQDKPNKPSKPISSKDSCTKRNPSPPCKKGFEEKTNKKGSRCCYKSKSKAVKPNKTSSAKDDKITREREAYLKWIEKVLEGKKITDKSGATLGYVPDNHNCTKQTSKKYTSPKRKSPPYKANLCCGEIKIGNDGNKWLSKMNKNGVCVWRSIK